MNYVEDSEYLGSCESLRLMALPVGVYGGRTDAQLTTIASLPSRMNWYNL